MQASKLDHKNSIQFIESSHASPSRKQGIEKTLQISKILKIPTTNAKTPNKISTQTNPNNDLKTKSSHTPNIRSQTDHPSRYSELEKTILIEFEDVISDS